MSVFEKKMIKPVSIFFNKILLVKHRTMQVQNFSFSLYLTVCDFFQN